MHSYYAENKEKLKKNLPTLPAEILRDVYNRMRVLLEEEKRWCDKGNYKHIAQILTSIALYEVLQQRGKTEEEAGSALMADTALSAPWRRTTDWRCVPLKSWRRTSGQGRVRSK